MALSSSRSDRELNKFKEVSGQTCVAVCNPDGTAISVDISGVAGDQFVNAAAVNAADKGNLMLGSDGSNYRLVKTDAAGELQVDVLTLPAITGTVAISGSVAITNVALTTLAAAITANKMQVDVVTLPALSATVSATDLDIRNLSSAQDSVAAVQSGNWAVRLQDGSGNALSSTTGYLDVNLKNASIAVTGTFWQATQPVSLASVPSHAVTNAGTFAVQTEGDVAHDGADSGKPVKVGYKAIAHGTNPTAVAAGDRTDAYANRAGIPFMIGGHPNIINKNINITDADGAQTDLDILGAIGAGTKIVVTYLTVAADDANTAAVAVRIGFGTANVPAADSAGIVFAHPGISAGLGAVLGNGGGIIGVGGDGAELRLTCEDPAGGAIDICVGYYTIES